ncbi:radical SAM protein, partial [Candidatus Gracilibacteria bacterium]|nr:radical SAM protein [Candidatus Gracilibacteria bacterium]
MLKTYYIKTFGCQMNYADSEKVDMILRSAGLRKVIDPVQADIVISNTCSVRQKGEDRVFGFIHEIERYHKINANGKKSLFGITGCMVRKSGLAKRYLRDAEGNMNDEYKRKNASMIALLDSSDALANYDDELFLRSQSIDFVFRIEEVSFLTKILSLITSEDIGNDAKFNEYLAVKQLQENPASANVIIQTGCDNYCSFCIVPYTRGREISRDPDTIVAEIREVVKNGTREVTLLGQNVNSYGKETKKKLWNQDLLTWNSAEVKTPFRELLENISEIDGLDRIRFTSSNPHDMTLDILGAHFDLPHMTPHLHFALQSGSDTMLARMNRK